MANSRNNLKRGTQTVIIPDDTLTVVVIPFEGKNAVINVKVLARNAAATRTLAGEVAASIASSANGGTTAAASLTNFPLTTFTATRTTPSQLDINIKTNVAGEDTYWFMQYEFIEMPDIVS
jgi:hypothetical protein